MSELQSKNGKGGSYILYSLQDHLSGGLIYTDMYFGETATARKSAELKNGLGP